MGLCCTISQISTRAVEELRSNSQNLESFLEDWSREVTSRCRERQLRLFGLPTLPSPTIDFVILEKSWDLIDLLLKVLDPGSGSLSQAILGGEPLDDFDGLKIQRYSDVQSISQALQLFTREDFQKAFVSAEYRAAVAKSRWKEDHSELFADLGIEFYQLYSMIDELISIYKDAEVCENCLLIEIG
jgi:hypothetical protein